MSADHTQLLRGQVLCPQLGTSSWVEEDSRQETHHGTRLYQSHRAVFFRARLCVVHVSRNGSFWLLKYASWCPAARIAPGTTHGQLELLPQQTVGATTQISIRSAKLTSLTLLISFNMAAVDFGRYKRMMEHFWDPVPKNDDLSASTIWCMGRKYEAKAEKHASISGNSQVGSMLGQEVDKETVILSKEASNPKEIQSCDANGGTMTHHTDGDTDQDWPSDFLDDFESRFWFTYRSHFPTIKQSDDPKAASAMTLAVRLRSQLVDHGGFTSDTGWDV